MAIIKCATCPTCEADIALRQFLSHTWWHPIVCRNCGAKLHFNRRRFLVLLAPVLTSMAALVLIAVVDKVFGARYFYLFLAMYLVFLVLAVRFLLTFTGRIKLEVSGAE